MRNMEIQLGQQVIAMNRRPSDSLPNNIESPTSKLIKGKKQDKAMVLTVEKIDSAETKR